MVEIEVEFVDAPMDYNLLLGRNWTYAMTAIVSTVFRVICFPHNGKIVTVDQLTFHRPESTSATSTIPMVGNTSDNLESVGARLFKDSSLLGIFSIPPPNPEDTTTFSPLFMIVNSPETNSQVGHDSQPKIREESSKTNTQVEK